ncbi:MAG: response regulator [Spirochaetaceae bacterium]|nr:MAG: response regulator [Spirochaetaceae bacterium]
MSEREAIKTAKAVPVRRVLVVDDDPQVASVLVEMLRTFGYHATSVAGADQAIRELPTIDPDVVITDLVMPEGEGMELLTHLWRSRHRHRPAVIAMSGNATGVQFLRASELLGACATLRKPFGPAELRDAMAAAAV